MGRSFGVDGRPDGRHHAKRRRHGDGPRLAKYLVESAHHRLVGSHSAFEEYWGNKAFSSP